MSNSRDKAIEELKKQIKLGRERLGEEGIKQLQEMAKRLPTAAAKPKPPTGSVEYDKKAALAAFEMFLKNHGDPEEFKRRLLAEIKKRDH